MNATGDQIIGLPGYDRSDDVGPCFIAAQQ
jgi:hypothetical protein